MKLKKLASLIIMPLVIAVGCLAPLTPTYADDICSNANVSAEIKAASGCENTGVQVNNLPDVITNILNGVIAVTGTISAIFVIIGGVNYMTSRGDSGKIEKAKNTILYALIGMTICALSFAIVNFVILKIIK